MDFTLASTPTEGRIKFIVFIAVLLTPIAIIVLEGYKQGMFN